MVNSFHFIPLIENLDNISCFFIFEEKVKARQKVKRDFNKVK